jgi:teichuronic acid biosynthesis protein TuaE
MITLQSKIPQIVIGIIVSVLLGMLAFPYISKLSLTILGAAFICITVGLLLAAHYRQYFWEKLTLEHLLLSLMLATSFLGSALLNVSAGPVMLFPSRILLMLLAGFIFLKWLNKGISLRGHFNIPFLYLFLLFWVAYSILALSWSVDLTPAIKEIFTLSTSILIIFLVTFLFKKEKNYLEFFTIWIVMGLFLMAIGIVEHRLQIHLPNSRINHAYSYQKGIPTAVFVNENDYGSFLGIASFFFLSLMKNGKRFIYQLVGLFGFACSLYLILITESRANYIGIFLGGLFWFLFLLGRKGKFSLIGFGLFLLPAAILLKFSKVLKVWNLLQVQIDSLFNQAGNPHSSIDIRENLLNNIKVFIENTYGLGVGPGNVEYYMKHFPIYNTITANNPHNWWGEIFVQYGFFIFIGYIIMFFFLFISLFRLWLRQRKTGNTLITEALLCGMLAFIIASISPNSFITLFYNWLFMAFVIAYVNHHYKEIRPGGLKND